MDIFVPEFPSALALYLEEGIEWPASGNEFSDFYLPLVFKELEGRFGFTHTEVARQHRPGFWRFYYQISELIFSIPARGTGICQEMSYLIRHFVAFVVLAVLGTAFAVEGAKEQQERKLNLLMIMTDQQRFNTLGRVQEDLGIPEQSRIRTPNLDRLSLEGAYFQNAYSHCAVCGPARTSLMTGRTIENTGVRTNGIAKEPFYPCNDAAFKIALLQTYDEILVKDYGYVAEYYGKFHSPPIKGGVYDNDVRMAGISEAWFGKFEADNFTRYKTLGMTPDYRHWLEANGVNNTVAGPGQQINVFSSRTYVMDPLDRRYSGDNRPSEEHGLEDQDCHGKNLVPDEFSLTSKYGQARRTRCLGTSSFGR